MNFRKWLLLLGALTMVFSANLKAAGYPATGPGVIPDEGLHLTFDGKPDPFVPQQIGQRVKVQAWFLGRSVPLDKLKITFPRGWAKLNLHHSGTYGWLKVLKLDVSDRDLGPENRYAYTIELKVASKGETKRGVTLTLDVPYRLHRLDATIKLTSGKVKNFDLRTHPDIYPVEPKDVYVWPLENEVLLWKNKLWVGLKTQELVWKDGVAPGIKPAGVVLVAVKLRQRSGGNRWLYTNIIPTTLQHPGWDDEASKLRLPVFPGSAKIYRDAAAYYRARGVPFKGLADISHVRGELTGK